MPVACAYVSEWAWGLEEARYAHNRKMTDWIQCCYGKEIGAKVRQSGAGRQEAHRQQTGSPQAADRKLAASRQEGASPFLLHLRIPCWPSLFLEPAVEPAGNANMRSAYSHHHNIKLEEWV